MKSHFRINLKSSITCLIIYGILSIGVTAQGAIWPLKSDDKKIQGTIRVDKKDQKKKKNTELIEWAKISLQDAVAIALKDTPGKVTSAKLKIRHHYLIFHVKISKGKKMATDVFVDAGSGSILDLDEEDGKDDDDG